MKIAPLSLLLPGLLAVSAPIVSAASTYLYLDFEAGSDPAFTQWQSTPTAGYTSVGGDKNFWQYNTLTAADIQGSGYDFEITNVNNFARNSDVSPLRNDGIFVENPDVDWETGEVGPPLAPQSVFTLSNLTPGQTVDLYAICGWDGNGDAGLVTFGGSSTLALEVGTPGTSPTLANFTFIGTAVADEFGKVSGLLNTPDSDSEGQLGGMIFHVVPEPSSSLLGVAGAALLVLRRRRLA